MSELIPLSCSVDLDVGESQTVTLSNNSTAQIKLHNLHEQRDPIRNAVRVATITVEINGQRAQLTAGNYELPVTVGGVQIDCPATRGYLANAMTKPWALEKDVRLRVWPKDSPWLEPGTFVYPISQRWFAGPMQTGNEPVYVDGAERPTRENIYYHDGLDFGGAEAQVDILAATGGTVIVAGDDVLPNENPANCQVAYDCVVIRDPRGWYIEYNHVLDIDPAIRPGRAVTMGQKIGLLGKTGGSGGWSHLHFCIKAPQPSGKFGTDPSYAYVWEAYQRQFKPHLIAVARPHRFGFTGDAITLDGSNSWSRCGKITHFEWIFSDGKTAAGPQVTRTYDRPGVYSEILHITDAAGHADVDFAIVEILNKDYPEQSPPGIHASYAPTLNLKPNGPITFQVRTFNTTFGEETWDFGDDSATATTRSDGNVNKHAKDGYARITHRYAETGNYIVTVFRANERGETAIARLHVQIE